MKKNNKPDNDFNTEKDTAPASAKIKGGEKKSESGSQPAKTTHKGKKSLRESWRSSSQLKKIEMILLGLVAVGGIGYLIAYIIVSISQNTQTKKQHAPLVINSRPPEFLQPFICDFKNGFRSGNMQNFVKNVGNATATNVFPSLNRFKIVPERKTGNAFIDEPPIGDCNAKMGPSAVAFPLAPGIEMRPQYRQTVMSLPNLTEGDSIQLYDAVCLYYSDDYGVSHGTCDTYRFYFPSNNPLDTLSGSPSFVCDGLPKNGKFVPHVTGHCQN
jgi:hypothetical protein